MINVYLRNSNGGDAEQLAVVSNAAEVEELFSQVKRAGVYTDGDIYHGLTMQYVISDDDGAYVEFITEPTP